MSAVLFATASVISLVLLTGLNLVSSQNLTNQTNTGTNLTNMTTSGSSGSMVKMHLEEGIKALENGDNDAAMTHLTAAQ
jgi:hypothetical protein